MRKRDKWMGVQMAEAGGVGTGRKGAIAVPVEIKSVSYDSQRACGTGPRIPLSRN
jgi:hypothetical protein